MNWKQWTSPLHILENRRNQPEKHKNDDPLKGGKLAVSNLRGEIVWYRHNEQRVKHKLYRLLKSSNGGQNVRFGCFFATSLVEFVANKEFIRIFAVKFMLKSLVAYELSR